MTAARVLFVFLDGVGLGSDDPATNPVAAAATPFIESLLGAKLTAAAEPLTRPGLVYRRLATTLGVDGLPQSATGQTTLLTGVNAAAVMGRHYGPWPGPTLLRLIEERGTLFTEAARFGGAVLANAYPPAYLAAMSGAPGGRRQRPNAPTFAAMAAGLELRDLNDYRVGGAAAADLSGERFAEMDPSLAPHGAAGTAAALLGLAAGAAFTFFDVWPTDALGHAKDFAGATRLLTLLDEVLARLVGQDVTLVVTSDHGNLEDLDSAQHTYAEVPLLVTGPRAEAFAGATSLLDVAPAIRAVWGDAGG